VDDHRVLLDCTCLCLHECYRRVTIVPVTHYPHHLAI
jgi:hypothetical protein